jgi:hypothetical protein
MRIPRHARFLKAAFATFFLALSVIPASADETSTTTTAFPTIATPKASYALGDIGPGGGFIFYVNAKGFNCGPNFTKGGSPTGGLCHYLEVAPSGWSNGKPGSTDANLPWSTKANYYKDVPDLANFLFPEKSAPTLLVNSSIGIGYKNSLAIVKQGNGVTSAAGAARAYRGSSLEDWYLPTLGELNNLLKWARGLPWKSDGTVVVGGKINSPTYGAGSAGLIASCYWSSTEGNRITKDVVHHVVGNPKFAHSIAWLVVNDDTYNEFIQIQPTEKINTCYVRPIRAF